MNDKYIAIRDCIECVRGNNSISGNPRYIFKFDDGSEVATEANSMFVYGLNTCSTYENKRLTFKYVVRRGKEIMTDFIRSKEQA
jgi:hypothetical protein